MYHAAQCEDVSPDIKITTMQVLFLVMYMFTGLMLILTAVSILAGPPQNRIASPFGNSLEIKTGISETQEKVIK